MTNVVRVCLLGMVACGRTPSDSTVTDTAQRLPFRCRAYRFVGEDANLVVSGTWTGAGRIEGVTLVDKKENKVVLERGSVDFIPEYRARSERRAGFAQFSMGSGQGNWWDGFAFTLYLPRELPEHGQRFQGELEESASDGGSFSRLYCFVG